MKMKKTIVSMLILLLLAVSICSAAQTVLDQVGHTMVGYVYGSVVFNVALNDAVPFDLESPSISENPSPLTSLAGLNIGTYTLQTNTDFKLYITHDALHLVERTFGTTYTDSQGNEVEDPGTVSAIDYRLYLQTGPNGTFVSCLSDSNAALSTGEVETAFQNQILLQGRDIDLPNQGIYLSLEDPSTITDPDTNETTTSTSVTVQQLKAGTYKSNIYFYLVVGT